MPEWLQAKIFGLGATYSPGPIFLNHWELLMNVRFRGIAVIPQIIETLQISYN
jgi:hypothetical protein